MLKLIIIILQASLSLKLSHSARLLGVFPMPASSHYILAEKLMRGFADAGHHVTFITPYPTKGSKNIFWEDVVLEGLAEKFKEHFKKINFFEDGRRSNIDRIISYQNLMIDWVNETMFNPKVRALLTPDNKFDAVVMEQFFNDCHKYFAHYFNCPLILMSSMGPNPLVNYIVGNPSPPSYIVHYFNSDNFNMESLIDRFNNLYDYIVDYTLSNFYIKPLQNRLLQQAFPGAPSTDDLNNKTSIILVNYHESLLEPVPLVPNMVAIGGYHVNLPKKLPKDIQTFLDNAAEGVIYFSMGSNIQAKEIPIERRRVFLNVFKKLNQKIMWKFEDENVSGLPDNVLVRKWMPQQDILAHPNVKLFITHGGFLSITETIYHGKPVLVIPVFADQFMNARKAVNYGYGLQLKYNDPEFNEKKFGEILNELLTNPKYTENAQFRSRIFHDRPLKPMENAVYWLNYTLRHQGAQHLKVAGAKLSIYKYLLLDVFFCISISILVIWYIVKALGRMVMTQIQNGSPRKQKII